MNERFHMLVSGAVLGLIIGWVLYIGKDVFVPIVFSVLVVYVIVGLTRLLARVPLLGRALPLRFHYGLSVLFIALGLLAVAYWFIANKNYVVALAPQYQQSLLAAIQRGAVFLGVESEPTWTTLRQELIAQVNIQGLIGTTVASVTSVIVSVVVVGLFATFLMIERRSFGAKIANISSDPATVARIRKVTTDINARVGSYLALKTFLSIALGAVSWVVMAFFGLELATFWAVLIALLNYVPYVGTVLGVLFPVAVSIVQFGNVNDVLALLVCLSIVQFVIGNVLDPYLMGNSLNLSLFAILASLTVWSALWGVAGAFLAVPITAILAIVFSEFAGTRPIAVLLSRNGEL